MMNNYADMLEHEPSETETERPCRCGKCGKTQTGIDICGRFWYKDSAESKESEVIIHAFEKVGVCNCIRYDDLGLCRFLLTGQFC